MMNSLDYDTYKQQTLLISLPSHGESFSNQSQFTNNNPQYSPTNHIKDNYMENDNDNSWVNVSSSGGKQTATDEMTDTS